MSNFLPEPGGVSDWWDGIIVSTSKEVQKRRSGRLVYALRNIWKERNMRFFSRTCMTQLEVAMLALEDIKQRHVAFGGAMPTVGVG